MSETTHFSDKPDQADEIDYRPFNSLALIAFLVALLSFVSMLNVVLVIVSVIAVVLALIAIRVTAGGNQMAGSSLATAAIFIAFLSSSLAVSQLIFRESYLKRHAANHASYFLNELFNGNWGSAYAYTVDPRYRPVEGTDLEAYYRQQSGDEKIAPIQQRNILLSLEPFPTMQKDGFDGTTEYLGTESLESDTGVVQVNDKIGVRYRYKPSASELPEIVYRVIMKRWECEPPTGTQWQAYTIEMLEGPSQANEMKIIGSSTPNQALPGQEK